VEPAVEIIRLGDAARAEPEEAAAAELRGGHGAGQQTHGRRSQDDTPARRARKVHR